MSAFRIFKSGNIPVLVWALLFSGSYFVFCLFTLDDFGITWDEPVHFRTGDLYLKALGEGRRVQLSPEDFSHSMENYGPVFDIISALSNRLLAEKLGWLPEDNARHLVLVAAASLTVFFTFLLTARGAPRAVAVFTALFLIGFPRFIGHSFNNPKDTPITFIFVLCLYLFYLRLTSGRRGYSLLLWLAGGVGFASRISYIIVPLIIFSYLVLRCAFPGKTGFPKLYSFWDVALALVLSFPAGMILWVYFWSEPMSKLKALFEFYYIHSTQAKLSILYQGKYYIPGINMPWHYAPVQLAITTPLITLGCSLLGLAVVIGSNITRSSRPQKISTGQTFYLLPILWIILGMIPFILPGQRVYDGIRHFLFIVPAICIIAGAGLNYLRFIVEKYLKKRLTYIIMIFLYLGLFYSVFSYHPFYTVYYNSLVGGPKGAYGRFSLEYWGNAYKSACHWLNKKAPFHSTVLALVAQQISRYYLRKDIQVFGPESLQFPFTTYDYSIYIIRNEDPLRIKNLEPIYSLSVKGQPILKIHRWN